MTVARLLELPLGASNFEVLRDSDQIYVDKTALIYRLAALRQKFFLNRPRRFGKSLLISTLASLFQNGLKYFSGLAIEKLWQDKTYQVVSIDFSSIKNFISIDDFYQQLDQILEMYFAPAGFHPDAASNLSLINQLSAWLQTRPHKTLVLLIDEYDAPLTACLDNKTLFNAVRKRLASFYAIIKSNDACWRFVFMTGIAKFNPTGIFSELNNFTDISLDPLFAPLLGYTEEDIDQYFLDYVEEASAALNLSSEEVRRQLRENYDGYCFDDEASRHLYAPWSVLQFFSRPSRGFLNYWMKSGGRLSMLQRYWHTHSLKAPEEYAEEKEVSYDDLDASTDFDGISDVVLLTQAGYLTIKQRSGRFFRVGYPNKEVADSLAGLYTDMLLSNRSFDSYGAGELAQAVCDGNADSLFEQVNHAFAAIDYQQHPIANEKHCQAFLLVFLKGLGFSAVPEQHGALGRSDLEVEAPKVHWVLELKYQHKGESVDALLAKAVAQIEEKQYGAASVKPLVRVAAVFSEEKRQFVCWRQVNSVWVS